MIYVVEAGSCAYGPSSPPLDAAPAFVYNLSAPGRAARADMGVRRRARRLHGGTA